jgi:hypothetical protein
MRPMIEHPSGPAALARDPWQRVALTIRHSRWSRWAMDGGSSDAKLLMVLQARRPMRFRLFVE